MPFMKHVHVKIKLTRVQVKMYKVYKSYRYVFKKSVFLLMHHSCDTLNIEKKKKEDDTLCSYMIKVKLIDLN